MERSKINLDKILKKILTSDTPPCVKFLEHVWPTKCTELPAKCAALRVPERLNFHWVKRKNPLGLLQRDVPVKRKVDATSK